MTTETRELTFGEKAVGLIFNPSNDALVQSFKEKAATFIDEAHALRLRSDDPEVKRMASIAITDAQAAQMWAVKAATWKN
jgi:hypothetical protein